MSSQVVSSPVTLKSPLSVSQHVGEFNSVRDTNVVEPTEANRTKSHVGPHLGSRMRIYEYSIEHNDVFWAEIARRDFYWKTTWPDDQHVKSYNFDKSKGPIFVKWFEGAVTNICYNALDRHLPAHKDRVCFYFEGNDPSVTEKVTYGSMYTRVVELANVLKHQYGITKGDRVGLYLPMIPFAAVAMLACARIGAVASVIFGGFSAQAIVTRVTDCSPKLIITADASSRGDKPILLKTIADQALDDCSVLGCNVPCLVFENMNRQFCKMKEGRDTWYGDALARLTPEQHEECPVEWMDAEDVLFLLYTSGSTGKPKAIVHTTAGYMVYASTTFMYSFDYHMDDVYFCTADIGWITGHSYVVYGPMIHCATSVLFEGVPNYPDYSRWWQLVEKYKVSILYTAPTAIRSLMQAGDDYVKVGNRSTLRVLGSVGEPINVEAWKWLRDVGGEGHCDVSDTWWQTETGGHMITPMPGCTPMKPGSATLPFFGVQPVILDPMKLNEKQGPAEGLLAIRAPWPGMARTIYGDHARFEKTYFDVDGYYMTGDGARRDSDGYYWITGRVDDVLNVSGHRIGTSEIEDAVNTHPAVVESAVVGFPQSIKGEGIYVFLTFHQGTEVTPELLAAVKATVRKVIGPLATPDVLHPTQEGLPKTRSGKIVRRILRKIATHNDDDLGDTSTLADPTVVEALKRSRAKWVDKK
ncbi:putative acetyl-CoA synthetase [Leishmania major strain Friedlin]|uniref:Acetyl-coenzyme A synthetase n=1 Tax=Leishmania major TaxID=5664 RepID=Q9U0W1_LEIMA|nr:putative acetyl-CoA synthetase [Leishmania major strain Friedlin]CAB55376.1 Acetyl-CoA synthetase [Leishmania major]CAG9574242.1 acetyl-CoA_synthetase_-_putative [Leishmania major strain Friedlin]CAJ04394.1 putative acetyl-CoA synthetase [Leishmania major strain Friedlin]|eukprot:XP_001683406.1 putative acetyl-CoA synthetase [Leishmania major strain Friedlin]